jgi:hypothetical protein
MSAHSNIVGGSTAKRVMNCPGSVALVQKMPPQPSSSYADTGTLLHNMIALVLEFYEKPEDLLGSTYRGITLCQEHLDNKIYPALAALDEVDPNREMEYEVEARVEFGTALPDVFGSCDLVGRIGARAIVLDWKFGDGVVVEADENPQLMFYAACSMRTERTKWAFEGATEVECIIVQPPYIRRWLTTFARIEQFAKDLVVAVRIALSPNAPLALGDHCKWCTAGRPALEAAKPICPLMAGQLERAASTTIKALDAQGIAEYLAKADLLEDWIKDLRALAFQMAESGQGLPGYKLVAKRSTRQWVNEDDAKTALLQSLSESEVMEASLISPAQAEKKLKKLKLALPEGSVVALSSGNTLVPESDPRPAVLLIGQQLTAALSKLV